jgi:hypothetical protein
MGNLKELTDKELEQLLYEYTHEKFGGEKNNECIWKATASKSKITKY